MRILLDESLPKELKSELSGHAVRTVQEMGWSSVKNWRVTVAGARALRRIRYRRSKSVSALPIAVAVIIAKSNRIDALRPLIPELLASLAAIPARTLADQDRVQSNRVRELHLRLRHPASARPLRYPGFPGQVN